MNISQGFLLEFDPEMKNTRSILELVPDNLLEWKAHNELNSIGWLASHIADTLSWTKAILKDTSFDVAPVGGEPHKSPLFDSSAEVLSTFDTNLTTSRSLIADAKDEELFVPWSLKQGGNDLFTMPRIAVIKTFMINHLVHHRAFLIAYLRMNDISCPSMYG